MIKTFILCLLLILPFSDAFAMFKRIVGVEDAQIERVVLSVLNQQLIYVASVNSLFRSSDRGKTFEKVAVFKNEEVRHLFFDPYLANTLYLATSRHIFRVTNDVEKIFSAPDEAEILTVAKFEEKIYAGTTQGLYFASEDILNWRRFKNLRNDVAIYSIAAAQGRLYFASSKGVYLAKNEDNIERVFIMRDADLEEEIGIIANIIKIDLFDEDKIWLGTNQGLFVSLDRGSSWNKLYIEAVDSLYINSLAQRKTEQDVIYLASAKGFFRVDLNRRVAQDISNGIYASKINWVEFGFEDRIYLATSKGAFVSDEPVLFKYGDDGLDELLASTPSIEEIQRAALRYNEISPDKIRRWRNGLKFRALFPNIDLDYNKSIYGTAGTNNYDGRAFVGPRDWSVGFSWDVGDVIWNSYEDDVDTRSRLNTQLRLDMLDEINRVYFERLRLKQEILTSSLAEEQLFQKQLRLKELDAIIDGYTGGHFSKRIKELNETN